MSLFRSRKSDVGGVRMLAFYRPMCPSSTYCHHHLLAQWFRQEAPTIGQRLPLKKRREKEKYASTPRGSSEILFSSCHMCGRPSASGAVKKLDGSSSIIVRPPTPTQICSAETPKINFLGGEFAAHNCRYFTDSLLFYSIQE